MVIKFGKWLTRHKAVVLIIAFLLLIPATIGYVSTRINYDLLSYLPNSLETVSGQDTMVDEFGMGAFSMIVVEDMEKKDIVALKEKLKKVNHVEDVIWYDDAMDISLILSAGTHTATIFQLDAENLNIPGPLYRPLDPSARTSAED